MNKKTLFREYMDASAYVNYTDIYSKAEVPIKTQLQSLLSNLPEAEQLAALEGDLRTLIVSIRAMQWESNSMETTVKTIVTDVLTIRQKLNDVTSTIQQMLRDVGLKNSSDSAHVDVGNIQEVKDEVNYNPKNSLDFKWDDWNGKSKGKGIEYFDRTQLLRGAKVELEHAKLPKLALRIAMDHLCEDPNYYKDLAKMEKGEEKRREMKEETGQKETDLLNALIDIIQQQVKVRKFTDDEVYSFHELLKRWVNKSV